MAGRCVLLSCGFSPTHDPPQAWTRREARHLGGSIAPVKEHDPIGNKRKHGAARKAWLWCLGAAAGPGRASRRRAERSSRRGRQSGSSQRSGRQAGSSQRGGRQAGSSQRGGRQAGSSRRGLRDDAPSEARGADAERAAHGADAERAARSADGEQAGRRPQTPTRRTRAYNEAGTRRAKQRRGPRPRETVRPGGPP